MYTRLILRGIFKRLGEESRKYVASLSTAEPHVQRGADPGRRQTTTFLNTNYSSVLFVSLLELRITHKYITRTIP